MLGHHDDAMDAPAQDIFPAKEFAGKMQMELGQCLRVLAMNGLIPRIDSDMFLEQRL